nr:hypothetical protein [Pectobacterium brasiliense]
MQSDMRRQPTQLSEVPYNDQTQVPRSQVTIKPPTQSMQQPPVRNNATRHTRTCGHANDHLLCRDMKQQNRKHRKQQPVKQPEAPKAEKTQRWAIQCGSFKTMDPAESVRAQLAFAVSKAASPLTAAGTVLCLGLITTVLPQIA